MEEKFIKILSTSPAKDFSSCKAQAKNDLQTALKHHVDLLRKDAELLDRLCIIIEMMKPEDLKQVDINASADGIAITASTGMMKMLVKMDLVTNS